MSIVLKNTGLVCRLSNNVARRGFAEFQEAKGNMVNGVKLSTGIRTETDKLDNAPYLNPGDKVGQEYHRKNQTDVEENAFPRNDVGSTYAWDNNLTGNKPLKKDEIQKEVSAPWEKERGVPSAVGAEKKIKFQDETTSLTGKPEGYQSEKEIEEMNNAFKDSFFKDKIAAAKAAEKTPPVKPVDENDYVSKWSAKDGEQVQPAMKRAAQRAAERAHETIPSNSDTIADALIGKMESASNAFAPVAEKFGNKVAEKLDGEKIAKTVTNISEKAKGGFETVKAGVSKAAETVKESFAYAAEAIPPMASNILHKAEDIAVQSKDAIMGKVADVSSSASETIKAKAADVSESASKAFNSKASDVSKKSKA